MEHRADELSDDEEFHADQQFKQLLAHYNEPAGLATPPTITSRVMSGIPGRPPGDLVRQQRRQNRFHSLSLGTAALLFLALFSLGFYGVLFDSSAPATLVGTSDGFAQLVLTLTLTAKPLVNLVLTSGLPLLPLLLLLLIGGGWLWHYLLRGSQKPAFDLG